MLAFSQYEEIDYTPIRFRIIIPNLPDLVLVRIFELLTYRDLVRLEVICKRWRSIILRMLKKDIRELNVEQSVTYSTITTSQQKPFKRLSLCCNFEALDFLSGVLRRSRMSVVKLSCDLRFLTIMDQLRLDREANRRYWSNVEDLWLVIARLDKETTEKFLNIEKHLFLNLLQMTVQIHESPRQANNVDRIISAIVRRFPKIQINMELHAKSSSEIFAQLLAFSPMSLKRLKVICLDYDPAVLSLTQFTRIAKQRCITMRKVTLRDWTIRCEPHQSLFHIPLKTFRISSCAIENVDHFLSAIRATVALESALTDVEKVKKQKAVTSRSATIAVFNRKENLSDELQSDDAKPGTDDIDRVPSIHAAKKTTGTKTKKCFIERLEIAGQCTFHGLGYLNDKAHLELEFRVHTVAPLMKIDSSRIYYYD